MEDEDDFDAEGDVEEGVGYREIEIREQDRYLPIANIARIMKRVLPGNAKIAKDAKESIQACVSEFISFITSEASDKCQLEKRKTINGDDLLWAMGTLGFENYGDPLRMYLSKYRESVKGEKPEKKMGKNDKGDKGGAKSSQQQIRQAQQQQQQFFMQQQNALAAQPQMLTQIPSSGSGQTTAIIDPTTGMMVAVPASALTQVSNMNRVAVAQMNQKQEVRPPFNPAVKSEPSKTQVGQVSSSSSSSSSQAAGGAPVQAPSSFAPKSVQGANANAAAQASASAGVPAVGNIAKAAISGNPNPNPLPLNKSSAPGASAVRPQISHVPQQPAPVPGQVPIKRENVPVSAVSAGGATQQPLTQARPPAVGGATIGGAAPSTESAVPPMPVPTPMAAANSMSQAHQALSSKPSVPIPAPAPVSAPAVVAVSSASSATAVNIPTPVVVNKATAPAVLTGASDPVVVKTEAKP